MAVTAPAKATPKKRQPKFDGAKLRKARRRRFPKLTMEDVARAYFNRSKQSLSDIERGSVDCSAAFLIEMMMAYRVYDIRKLLPAKPRRARA